MKVRFVNTGLPIEVQHHDRTVQTAIWKRPRTDRVRVFKTGLDGDGQADLSVHGGPSKAVYAYAQEHYSWWAKTLGRDELEPGQFGENLTIEGLDESEICLGDHWRIGGVLLAVTEPRVPCFKLGIRFGDDGMPRRFTAAALTGIYFAVLEEGELGAGDPVTVETRGPGAVTVKSFFESWFHRRGEPDTSLWKRALEVPELPEKWRDRLNTRLGAG